MGTVYLGLGTAILSDGQVRGLSGPRAPRGSCRVRCSQRLEERGLLAGRKTRLCLGGVLGEWVWGPVLECRGAALEAEHQPAPDAHLFPAPPLPRAASASLEKPAAQETAGGAQTAAPPPAAPRRPHRDRPTHLKGPWLPGLPPSRRLPPHLRAALFITRRLFRASGLEPAAVQR